MKNLRYMLLFVGVIFGCEKEEDLIYSGDVSLTTLKEVEEFGAKHDQEINGSLLLGEEGIWGEVSDINTISALSSLQKISDDLLIRNNSLVNLIGLDNLNYIGGNMLIENNHLQNLIGLENIHFEGSLTITGNRLNDITSLSHLTFVQNMYISEGEISLPFDNIFTIPGNVHIAIKNFEGIRNLTAVGGNFELYHCDKISMEGLNKLSSIGGEFTIANCEGLKTFTGLSNLEKIGGGLFINDCDNIETLTSLSTLKEVGSIHLYGNDSLKNLNGLTNLTMIDNLYIIENFNLNTLEGLDSLKTITGSLFRIDRNAITNLDGLANLQSITNLDLFSITGNNELTDFCGLRKGMESIPENLYLSIYFNAYNPTREAIINGNCAQ